MTLEQFEQAKREFAEKWMPMVRYKDKERFIECITALLEQYKEVITVDMYPKEFVEWYVVEVSNDRARIYPYCYMIWVDGTGIGFDTFDELFNYWRENEQ